MSRPCLSLTLCFFTDLHNPEIMYNFTLAADDLIFPWLHYC